jgi:Domain of unknown function (DUF4062)
MTKNTGRLRRSPRERSRAPPVWGGAPMNAPIVFFSHTSVLARFPERRNFVQAAKDAALRAGLSAGDMQFFPAGDRPPALICEDAVRACQIYIGIFGHDYGSRVRERPDISYTELEFLTAMEEKQRGNMRVFVFLLCDGVSAGDHDTPDGAQAVFRRRMCEDYGLTVKFFEDPASLELEVYHALRETRSAGRRFSPLRRLGGWTAAGLFVAAATVAATYWLTPRGTNGPDLTSFAAAASPPDLKDLTIAIGAWENKRRVSEPQFRRLVAGGADQVLEALPPLTDRDAFRLYGTFDRPVYWYLAWFDTEGQFEVNDACPERQVELKYPSDDRWQPVNPTDRKGIHLLMLVAGDRPSVEGKPELQQTLGNLGRPPQTLPPLWAVRGGGERIADGGEKTTLDYLAGIRRKLPPGFHAVYSLWLQTE